MKINPAVVIAKLMTKFESFSARDFLIPILKIDFYEYWKFERVKTKMETKRRDSIL